jgi:hypothetical protein
MRSQSKSARLKAFVAGIEKIQRERANNMTRAELELAETLKKVTANDKGNRIKVEKQS